MKTVIMGGSGFIGTALAVALFTRGDIVLIPTRSLKKQSSGNLQFSVWDGISVAPLAQILRGADAVVNLIGENIAARHWSKEQKERILQSRVKATTALVEALKSLPSEERPKTLIQGSAIGYYGAYSGEVSETCCLENAPSQEVAVQNTVETTNGGFLAQVARSWEAASQEVESLGLRRVIIRTAPVLDSHGGMLPRLMLPFSLYLGATPGSGKQYFSWIHLADEIGAILHLLDSPNLSGPFNLSAPEPMPVKTFNDTLGQIMKRPSFLKIPAFIIKAALGEMAEELILSGQRAMPKRLLESGYKFKFPTLRGALIDIISK